MRKIVLLTIVVFCACRRTNQEALDSYPSKVVPYVETFLKEGKDRGWNIKLGKLRIKLSDHYNTHSFCGGIEDNACYAHKEDFIIVDTLSNVWQTKPELVMYHELGHARLRREHVECIIEGRALSIMKHDLPLEQDFIGRESGYFDELFRNPKTVRGSDLCQQQRGKR